MSHISYLRSKRVNHCVANLVNLPVYSLLSGITLLRAHGEKWSLSRARDGPLSFTPRLTEYANRAHRREQWLLLDSSAFGHFGRMVWQRPALLEPAAQMCPFKCLVDFKGAALPLHLSKSGMMVCHKVSPFAPTTALSLDHAPEMKGHLGYIWNRSVVT